MITNKEIVNTNIYKTCKGNTKMRKTNEKELLLIKTKSNSALEFMYPMNDKTLLKFVNNLDLPIKQIICQELCTRPEDIINKNQKIKSKNRKITTKMTICDLAKLFLENNDIFKKNTSYSKSTKSLINRAFIKPKSKLFKTDSIADKEGNKISIEKFLKFPANDITEIEIKNFIDNIKDRTTKQKLSNLLLAMYKIANLNKQVTGVYNNPAKILKTIAVKFEQSSCSDKMIVTNSELNTILKLLNNLSSKESFVNDDKLLLLAYIKK